MGNSDVSTDSSVEILPYYRGFVTKIVLDDQKTRTFDRESKIGVNDVKGDLTQRSNELQVDFDENSASQIVSLSKIKEGSYEAFWK